MSFLSRCLAVHSWFSRPVYPSTDLTQHEQVLGGMHWYCEEVNFFGTAGKEIAKTQAKRAKKSEVQREIFELLRIFALVAWVEMTERWYAMPSAVKENTAQSLPRVSNMFPLEVRCLAKHVREEEHLSSLPLVADCSLVSLICKSS